MMTKTTKKLKMKTTMRKNSKTARRK